MHDDTAFGAEAFWLTPRLLRKRCLVGPRIGQPDSESSEASSVTEARLPASHFYRKGEQGRERLRPRYRHGRGTGLMPPLQDPTHLQRSQQRRIANKTVRLYSPNLDSWCIQKHKLSVSRETALIGSGGTKCSIKAPNRSNQEKERGPHQM